MAITQVNPTDFNYSKLSDAQTQTYKGKADITISEYDTTAAPDVKVGSVFDNNGTLFIVDTADLTPTGYAGISNSTTFYLYYDESAGAFIYSETAPTWSDALQGWYNGNDTAFFSMYKDSGGTLYEGKVKLSNNGDVSLRTKVIEIGDWDMDTTASVDITHGIGDSYKIRSVFVSIRKDSDAGTPKIVFPLTWNYSYGTGAEPQSGDFDCDDDHVTCRRDTGGHFDSADYNATSYNRGWITIVYEG